MKLYGQNTGKIRNHDYDPAEKRPRPAKPRKPACRRLKGTCPLCGLTGK